MKKNRVLVFYYDDQCGFCTWGTEWLRRADLKNRIELRSVNSCSNEVPGGNSDTAWLFDTGKWYYGSSALIRAGIALGFPYIVLGILLIVPGFIREAVYKAIARNRYLLPGNRIQACEKKELP
jgi:predicted DCC family thiol-disulfide oxidoreductase YuxK